MVPQRRRTPEQDRTKRIDADRNQSPPF